MRAFLPIGIVFLAIGATQYSSQGLTQGVAFLAMGVTFIILALVKPDVDSGTDSEKPTDS